MHLDLTMAHAGSIRLSHDWGIHNNHGRSNPHTVCHMYKYIFHFTVILVALVSSGAQRLILCFFAVFGG